MADIADVPVPIQANILKFLHPDDFRNISCVCARWNAILKEDSLWFFLIVDRFGTVESDYFNHKQQYPTIYILIKYKK